MQDHVYMLISIPQKSPLARPLDNYKAFSIVLWSSIHSRKSFILMKNSMFKRLKCPRLIFSGVGISLFLGFMYFTNVSMENHPESYQYIEKILRKEGVKAFPTTFDDEIKLIKSIQNHIIKNIDESRPIPQNASREPKDILKLGYGQCHDKSRVIEMALTYCGFKVRHAAIYELQNNSVFKTLIQPQVSSHAVTEVLTSKGWLLVDPNNLGISLDSSGNPLTLHKIKQQLEKGFPEPNQHPIFYRPFTYVYGLYSRHGKFYPPYIHFPNINWRQFLDNFS